MTPRQLGLHEAEFRLDTEPGLSVVLRYPEDFDLAADILQGRMTIAKAIKRVALRRQLERETVKIERSERENDFWRVPDEESE